MTASGKHRPMGARELVLLALLGALLHVTKLALAWLPNIEPVSLLVLVYTAVLGWKALAPVYVYVMMEILIWGLAFGTSAIPMCGWCWWCWQCCSGRWSLPLAGQCSPGPSGSASGRCAP